jgi:hypothetical protein
MPVGRDRVQREGIGGQAVANVFPFRSAMGRHFRSGTEGKGELWTRQQTDFLLSIFSRRRGRPSGIVEATADGIERAPGLYQVCFRICSPSRDVKISDP